MSATGIGASVRRIEDVRFITGRGRYTDDIEHAGQVYAVFLRSPYARARIAAVDSAAALDVDGVLAVLTGRDMAGDGIGIFISLPGNTKPSIGASNSPPAPDARGSAR